jgi:hypothetical protein
MANDNNLSESLSFDDLDDGNTYDKVEAQKSGDYGEDVPDGKYQCQVDKAWLARSKKGNKRMLRWQLKIVGGEHSGRVLFRNNMIETPDNIKWLKGDLEVCGLTIHKLNELNEKVDKLLGVSVEVQVKNRGKDAEGRTNQNVYLNKLVDIDRTSMGSSGATGAGTGSADDNTIPF